jgi:quercetin dioxygenase-like cupin family protein
MKNDNWKMENEKRLHLRIFLSVLITDDLRCPMTFLLAIWLLQAHTVALENEYVRVTRDTAPCASSATPGCGDRVIVALGEIELRFGKSRRKMIRGDIAVFKTGESYKPPVGGPFFEVAIKANHPPVQSPRELILPEKNVTRYDGERFFIFEEKLPVGDTRPRHSHSQRVVIQLNRTRLQQWPEGEPEIVREIVPDRVAFNPPVIHTVKNVGDAPLRGIVIEFKAERRKLASK